ncbi:hypothetical protein AVEN_152571-1 [Araneus ventricosus]|uniref:CTP synthase N-terminal domain-containing protein n=1 Tax=Araneus ventricosus TaxID=182803 RepID=A0A4Y2R767_ARAVE|nr:hypothetical protein AVEN_152571-1 [Araneus ventricosus]
MDLFAGKNSVLVTGGGIRSIGKGVIASSIGKILKSNVYEVTAIKIDPYVNIDAGTFSPYEQDVQVGIVKQLDAFFANIIFLSWFLMACAKAAMVWLVRSRLKGRRVPGSKPGSSEDPSCIGPFARKITLGAKRHPVGMVRKSEEGMPDQVSSSSSD